MAQAQPQEQVAYSDQEIDAALDSVREHNPRAATSIIAQLDEAAVAGDVPAFNAIAKKLLGVAESLQRDAPPKGGTPLRRRGSWAPPPTHVVTADQLAKAEPGLYRFIAAGLWLFSTAGNVLAFAGGWSQIKWDTAFWVALAASVVWQLGCSAVQYITCRHWTNPIYLLALTASFVPAFIGYRLVIVVPLSQWLAGAKSDVFASLTTLQTAEQSVILGALVVHAIAAIGLVAADVIPERVFVKH